MPDLLANNFRHRRSFAEKVSDVKIENLIEIQNSSYELFLQRELSGMERDNIGLQAVFKSVFPIQDFSQRASLQYVSYALDEAKYDVPECRARGMTYSAPLKVTVRLVVWDVDLEANTRTVSNIKEQEVYFGEIPLMTENGTFIVNGTERVVVSQLHRSPGIFFSKHLSKTAGNKTIFSARIIPNRGSWIDFEFDSKDMLYVRIDRRRKLPATVLLRALGYSNEELLNYFYETETYRFGGGSGWSKDTTKDLVSIQAATVDLVDPDSGEILVREGRKYLKNSLRRMRKAGILQKVEVENEDSGELKTIEICNIPVSEESVYGHAVAHDVVDMNTGEILIECNEELTEENVAACIARGVDEFEVLYIDNVMVGSFLRDTLLMDQIGSTEEAVVEIYRRLRPGDPPTYQTAKNNFNNLFFNAERYDLSKVGRLKLNHKLGLDLPLTQTTLMRDDLLRVVNYLINLKNNRGELDDIDHLGNRRIRAVGELLENQYRIGLVRMEKAIRERMSLSEIDAMMPNDLINAKPVSAVIKEFFGASQLSQFMDQTNPLSEVTHKRRLSALGPGGLTRERAGFDVRDVHPTHYGRICPIETPEGPNIGLIASMATYAKVNEFGFIESPYQIVKEGKITGEVRFMSALDEEGHVICESNTSVDDGGVLADVKIPARRRGEYAEVTSDEVTLMDVAPHQLVSVGASLIPFLENDDANRALMGSNMQRQAVPVLKTEAPLVGTGMELIVARDSGGTVTCIREGVVDAVDASRIVIKTDDDGEEGDVGGDVDIYNLVKFVRSNQNTCINQRPVVKLGDRVEAGSVIADGPATDTGELALGQNPVVAFMPWQGYNFEDSILLSERLVLEDNFTTIHIEEFEVAARDTKLGKEEITRDIPNVGEEALSDLDESGIIRIGAPVRQGTILVGKITPKGETQLSPEEKLLRAIFGEKAGDVRDTSLRVSPGCEGTVIDARVFAREGVEIEARGREIQGQQVAKLERDRDEKIRTIHDSASRQLSAIVLGKKSGGRLLNHDGEEFMASGDKFTADNIANITFESFEKVVVDGDSAADEQIWSLVDRARAKEDEVRTFFAGKIERIQKGDDLPPGVIKLVKIYVAIKRKLNVGDKMAGRHGNKGVVSRILPQEDMPYLADGTPVDVVLNPLGVPSRMNVGQVLEVHLGWAARGMGIRIGELIDEAYSVDSLKDYLNKVFAGPQNTDVQDFIATANEDDLKAFASKYRKGVTTATPVFAGAKEAQIKDALELAGYDTGGQTVLYDGRTGEAFSRKVTVGVMYMLKLHHLVDDKIHARSIGPYSLVTQQPLGGKAQFGGQRLGEMEVWALEAYGAAYNLQEFLTVKSDDVAGRTRMYESIVKGENVLEAGLPESFNVLVKELQALALDVNLIEDKDVLLNK